MQKMRKTVVTLAFLFVGAVLWAQTNLRDGMAVLEKKYGIHFVYDASLPLERSLKGDWANPMGQRWKKRWLIYSKDRISDMK